ncbi:hypothetical protein CBR_g911 [Chara braunii]|uniref:Laminin G domain-containing protein n=1 Tax=Chara braunii TaxID=69332 RepID=A0A388KCQ1_CHABU|nr:hypothetical protein CBR_g911 [Chara braunii]|eukprot:GBG67786.1 hypothetical protein CBR_g911 [Chara braunii]
MISNFTQSKDGWRRPADEDAGMLQHMPPNRLHSRDGEHQWLLGTASSRSRPSTSFVSSGTVAELRTSTRHAVGSSFQNQIHVRTGAGSGLGSFNRSWELGEHVLDSHRGKARRSARARRGLERGNLLQDLSPLHAGLLSGIDSDLTSGDAASYRDSKVNDGLPTTVPPSMRNMLLYAQHLTELQEWKLLGSDTGIGERGGGRGGDRDRFPSRVRSTIDVQQAADNEIGCGFYDIFYEGCAPCFYSSTECTDERRELLASNQFYDFYRGLLAHAPILEYTDAFEDSTGVTFGVRGMGKRRVRWSRKTPAFTPRGDIYLGGLAPTETLSMQVSALQNSTATLKFRFDIVADGPVGVNGPQPVLRLSGEEMLPQPESMFAAPKHVLGVPHYQLSYVFRYESRTLKAWISLRGLLAGTWGVDNVELKSEVDNYRPWAEDREETSNPDQPLTIELRGHDPECSKLTYLVTSVPERGTLFLCTCDSIWTQAIMPAMLPAKVPGPCNRVVYVPQANMPGAADASDINRGMPFDSFLYAVRDQGGLDSRPARVTVYIKTDFYPGTPVAGVAGFALAFDGQDDVLSIARTPSTMGRLTQLTVDVRFLMMADEGHRNALVSRKGGFWFGWDRLGGLGMEIQGEDGNFVGVWTMLKYNDRRWHHAAATWNESALAIYIDGQLVESTQVHITAISPSSFSYASPGDGGILVGADPSQESDGYFHGYVDELRLWNRSLNEAEIRDCMMMEGQLNTTEERGLFVYLQFNDNEYSLPVVFDQTHDRNDGFLGKLNSDGYSDGDNSHWPRYVASTAVFGNVVKMQEDESATILLHGGDKEGGVTFYISTLPRKGRLYTTQDGWTRRAEITSSPIRIGGNKVIYVPAKNGHGQPYDIFKYQAYDGKEFSYRQGVVIHVESVNDPPIVAPRTIYAFRAARVVVLLQAEDPEGEQTTLQIDTLPEKGLLYQASDTGRVAIGRPITTPGTIVTNKDGCLVYYPLFNGHDLDGMPYDSFSYLANDGLLDSPEATVTIHVSEAGLEEKPVAGPGGYALLFDGVDDVLYLGTLEDYLTFPPSSPPLSSSLSSVVSSSLSSSSSTSSSPSSSSPLSLRSLSSSLSRRVMDAVLGPFAVECWFRTSALMGEKDITLIVAGPFVLRWTKVAGLQFSVGSKLVVDSFMTCNDGTWHHVSAAWNASSATMIVDGKQIATSSRTAEPVLPETAAMWDWKSTRVIAGGGLMNGTQGFYSGAIDEIRIWRTERDAQSVQGDMMDPLLGDLPLGLVGHYRLNEAHGDRLENAATGARDGERGLDGLQRTQPTWIASTAPIQSAVVAREGEDTLIHLRGSDTMGRELEVIIIRLPGYGHLYQVEDADDPTAPAVGAAASGGHLLRSMTSRSEEGWRTMADKLSSDTLSEAKDAGRSVIWANDKETGERRMVSSTWKAKFRRGTLIDSVPVIAKRRMVIYNSGVGLAGVGLGSFEYVVGYIAALVPGFYTPGLGESPWPRLLFYDENVNELLPAESYVSSPRTLTVDVERVHGTPTGCENVSECVVHLAYGETDDVVIPLAARHHQYSQEALTVRISRLPERGVLRLINGKPIREIDTLVNFSSPMAGNLSQGWREGFLVLYSPPINAKGSPFDWFGYHVVDNAGLMSAESWVVINVEDTGMTFPRPVVGSAGLALLFDGVDDIVTLGKLSTYGIDGTGVAIACWFRASALLGVKASALVVGGPYQLIWTPFLGLQFRAGSAVAATYAQYNDGSWHFVVGSWDGREASISVDFRTVAVARSDRDIWETRDLVSAENHVLTVGGDINSTARNYRGEVDELSLWKRHVPLVAVNRAAKGQAFLGNELGLVGYWRFNEATGTGVRNEKTGSSAQSAAPDIFPTEIAAALEGGGSNASRTLLGENEEENLVGMGLRGAVDTQPQRVISTLPLSNTADVEEETMLPLDIVAVSENDAVPPKVRISVTPKHGTVRAEGFNKPLTRFTRVPASAHLTYLPTKHFIGEDRLIYTVEDGVLQSIPQSFSIFVNRKMQPSLASSLLVQMDFHSPSPVTVDLSSSSSSSVAATPKNLRQIQNQSTIEFLVTELPWRGVLYMGLSAEGRPESPIVEPGTTLPSSKIIYMPMLNAPADEDSFKYALFNRGSGLSGPEATVKLVGTETGLDRADTPVAGPAGLALSFDGRSSVATLGSLQDYSVRKDMMFLECWFRTSAVSSALPMTLVSAGSIFAIKLHSLHGATLSIGAKTVSIFDSFNQGSWHHLVASYNGSHALLMIGNRTATATGTAAARAATYDERNSAETAVTLGASLAADTPRSYLDYLNGEIDDLQIGPTEEGITGRFLFNEPLGSQLVNEIPDRPGGTLGWQGANVPARVTSTAPIQGLPLVPSPVITLLEDSTVTIKLLAFSSESMHRLEFTIVELPLKGSLFAVDRFGRRGPGISHVPRVLSRPYVMFQPLADTFSTPRDEVYATFAYVANVVGPLPAWTSAVVRVALVVHPLDDPPFMASTTMNVEVAENSVVNITLTGSDKEEEDLVYTITTIPTAGLLFQVDGTLISSLWTNVTDPYHVVRFAAPLNQRGSPLTSFGYVVSDGGMHSEECTVNIHVAGDAALRVDGYGALAMDDVDLLQGGGSFSIEAWIRADNSTTSFAATIIETAHAQLMLSESGMPEAELDFPWPSSNGSMPVKAGNPAYLTPWRDRWHHLVVVVDAGMGGGLSNFFVDGMPISTQSSLGDWTKVMLMRELESSSKAFQTRMLIGSDRDWKAPYKGDIDDVRIWRRGLQTFEIHSLFANGRLSSGGSEEGLISHFSFDDAPINWSASSNTSMRQEHSDMLTKDLIKPSRRVRQLGETSLVKTHSPTLGISSLAKSLQPHLGARGTAGYALCLDGIDDFGEFAFDSRNGEKILTIHGGVTMEMWFKISSVVSTGTVAIADIGTLSVRWTRVGGFGVHLVGDLSVNAVTRMQLNDGWWHHMALIAEVEDFQPGRDSLPDTRSHWKVSLQLVVDGIVVINSSDSTVVVSRHPFTLPFSVTLGSSYGLVKDQDQDSVKHQVRGSFLAGVIDEFRLFDHKRSLEEIEKTRALTLYKAGFNAWPNSTNSSTPAGRTSPSGTNSSAAGGLNKHGDGGVGIGGQGNGLLAYYPFDNDLGNVAVDWSGKGHNLELRGDPVWLYSTAPLWSNGTEVPEDGKDIVVHLEGADVDGDAIRYSIVELPPRDHGTVFNLPDNSVPMTGVPAIVTDPGGRILFRPEKDFHGIACLWYVADDGRHTSPPGLVAIDVTPMNDAPVLKPSLTVRLSKNRTWAVIRLPAAHDVEQQEWEVNHTISTLPLKGSLFQVDMEQERSSSSRRRMVRRSREVLASDSTSDRGEDLYSVGEPILHPFTVVSHPEGLVLYQVAPDAAGEPGVVYDQFGYQSWDSVASSEEGVALIFLEMGRGAHQPVIAPAGNALILGAGPIVGNFSSVEANLLWGLLDQLTVELWMRTSTAVNQDTLLLQLANARPGSSLLKVQLKCNALGGLTLEVRRRRRRMSVAHSLVHINDGAWHHVAATYTRTMITLHVDGVIVSSAKVRNGTRRNRVRRWPLLVLNHLSLGGTGGDDSRKCCQFTGSIDELRIWDLARSEDEIKRGMRCILTGMERELLLYFNFDEQTMNTTNITTSTRTDIATVNSTKNSTRNSTMGMMWPVNDDDMLQGVAQWIGAIDVQFLGNVTWEASSAPITEFVISGVEGQTVRINLPVINMLSASPLFVINAIPTRGTLLDDNQNVITNAPWELNSSVVWFVGKPHESGDRYANFKYIAIDDGGVKSDEGTINITFRRIPEAPSPFLMETTIKVSDSQPELIALTVRDHDLMDVTGEKREQVQFRITTLPHIGRLYQVEEDPFLKKWQQYYESEAGNDKTALLWSPISSPGTIVKRVNVDESQGIATAFVLYSVADGYGDFFPRASQVEAWQWHHHMLWQLPPSNNSGRGAELGTTLDSEVGGDAQTMTFLGYVAEDADNLRSPEARVLLSLSSEIYGRSSVSSGEIPAQLKRPAPRALSVFSMAGFALALDGIDDYILVQNRPSTRRRNRESSIISLRGIFTVELWMKTSTPVQEGVTLLTRPGVWTLSWTKNQDLAFHYQYGLVNKTTTIVTCRVVLLVGADEFLSGDRFFNGALDEIRLWSIPRTDMQLKEAMHAAISGRERGLVGYWQFENKQMLIAEVMREEYSEVILQPGAASLMIVNDTTRNGLHGLLVGRSLSQGPFIRSEVPLAWHRLVTDTQTPLRIQLLAVGGDDGASSLTFTITRLPSYGRLSKSNGKRINRVPYQLPKGSSIVIYTPSTRSRAESNYSLGQLPPPTTTTATATANMHGNVTDGQQFETEPWEQKLNDSEKVKENKSTAAVKPEPWIYRDDFSFLASDGAQQSKQVNGTIYVVHTNSVPVAKPTAASVTEGRGVVINLSVVDADQNDNLKIIISTLPDYGSLFQVASDGLSPEELIQVPGVEVKAYDRSTRTGAVFFRAMEGITDGYPSPGRREAKHASFTFMATDGMADSSGAQVDLEIGQDVQYPIFGGIRGYAIRCDGVDDYVSLTGYQRGVRRSGFTVEAWVRTVGAVFDGATIIGAGTFSLAWSALGGMGLHFRSTWWEGASSSLPDYSLHSYMSINDGLWHHVAATWKPPDAEHKASQAWLYIDGNLVASKVWPSYNGAIGSIITVGRSCGINTTTTSKITRTSATALARTSSKKALPARTKNESPSESIRSTATLPDASLSWVRDLLGQTNSPEVLPGLLKPDGGDSFFSGMMDEIRMYSPPLSEDKLRESMNWSVEPSNNPPNLVLHLRFNNLQDLSTGTVLDLSPEPGLGNVKQGKLHGSPTMVISDVPIALKVETAMDVPLSIDLAGTDAYFSNLSAIITALPEAGALHQVDRDGSAGEKITDTFVAVTDELMRVVFVPEPGTKGDPTSRPPYRYASFRYTINDGKMNSAEDTVVVFVKRVQYPPKVVKKYMEVQVKGVEDIPIVLQGTDRDDDLLTTYITTLPTFGLLYQAAGWAADSERGAVGKRIQRGDLISRPWTPLSNHSNTVLFSPATGDLLTEIKQLEVDTAFFGWTVTDGRMFQIDVTEALVVFRFPRGNQPVHQWPANGDGADVRPVAGEAGMAAAFDGLHGRLVIHGESLHQLRSEMTVEAWVKTSVGTCMGAIVSSSSFILSLHPIFGVRFTVYLGEKRQPYTTVPTHSPLPLNDGGWHFISGVFMGNSMWLYVDGRLAGRKDLAVAIPFELPKISTLTIGGSITGGHKAFSGLIDDVRLWSVGLQPSTYVPDGGYHWTARGQGLVGNEQGLVGYWRFNQFILEEISVDSESKGNGQVGQEEREQFTVLLVPNECCATNRSKYPFGVELDDDSFDLVASSDREGGVAVIPSGAPIADDVVLPEDVPWSITFWAFGGVPVITRLPAHGVLVRQDNNQSIDRAPLVLETPVVRATYFPEKNYNTEEDPNGPDSIEYHTVGVNGLESPTVRINIHVASVNDPPYVLYYTRNKTLQASEPTMLRMVGADADGPPPKLLITQLPHWGHLYQVTNDQDIGELMTFGPAEVYNKDGYVWFKPLANAYGDAYDELTFIFKDSEGASSEETTVIITALPDTVLGLQGQGQLPLMSAMDTLVEDLHAYTIEFWLKPQSVINATYSMTPSFTPLGRREGGSTQYSLHKMFGRHDSGLSTGPYIFAEDPSESIMPLLAASYGFPLLSDGSEGMTATQLLLRQKMRQRRQLLSLDNYDDRRGKKAQEDVLIMDEENRPMKLHGSHKKKGIQQSNLHKLHNKKKVERAPRRQANWKSTLQHTKPGVVQEAGLHAGGELTIPSSSLNPAAQEAIVAVEEEEDEEDHEETERARRVNRTLSGQDSDWDFDFRTYKTFPIAMNFSNAARQNLSLDIKRKRPRKNQWHHIAAVFDGRLKSLYVDGLLQSSQAVQPRNASSSGGRGGVQLQGHLGALSSLFNTYITLPGAVPPAPTGWTPPSRKKRVPTPPPSRQNISLGEYAGLLDQLRIWNQARTQGQLADTLFTHLTGAEDHLLFYAAFDRDPPKIVTAVSSYLLHDSADSQVDEMSTAATEASENTGSKRPVAGGRKLAAEGDSLVVWEEGPNMSATTDGVRIVVNKPVAGVAGYALHLNSSGPVAVFGDDVLGNGAHLFNGSTNSSFTIEMWFRTTESSGGPSVLLSKGWVLPKWEGAFSLQWTRFHGFGFFIQNRHGDRFSLSTEMGFNDGAWHWVSAIWDNGKPGLYVDGRPAAVVCHVEAVNYHGTEPDYLPPMPCSDFSCWADWQDCASVFPCDDPIILGSDPKGLQISRFSGTIDDFHLLSKARTPTEIAKDYAQGKLGNESDPSSVAFFRFNEATGTVLHDSRYLRTVSLGGGKDSGNQSNATANVTYGHIQLPPQKSTSAKARENDIPINVAGLWVASSIPYTHSQYIHGFKSPAYTYFDLYGADADGDALDFYVTHVPEFGILYDSPDGGITRGHRILKNGTLVRSRRLLFRPVQRFWAKDEILPMSYGSFAYAVSDGKELSRSEGWEILVYRDNIPPEAFSKTVTTMEDTPLDISLDGIDPEGGSLYAEILAGPVHGILTPNLTIFASQDSVNGSVHVSYVPNPDFNGPDVFQFVLIDRLESSSNVASIFITVTPVDDPPQVTMPGSLEMYNPYERLRDVAVMDVDELDEDNDPSNIAVLTVTLTARKGVLVYESMETEFGRQTSYVTWEKMKSAIKRPNMTLSGTAREVREMMDMVYYYNLDLVTGGAGNDTVAIQVSDAGSRSGPGGPHFTTKRMKVFVVETPFRSVRFSDDGHEIYVEYKEATDRAGMPVGIPRGCRPLLRRRTVDVLGDNATCEWLDSSTYVISLGPFPIIEPEWYLLSTGKRVAFEHSREIVPSSHHMIGPPMTPLRPEAQVFGPTRVGPCDGLTLEALGSAGHAGRLMQFKWGYVGSSLWLRSMAKAAKAPRIVLRPRDVKATGSYTFTLQVRNFLRMRSTPVRFTFKRMEDEMPIVYIDGGAHITTFPAAPVRLRAIAKPASVCETLNHKRSSRIQSEHPSPPPPPAPTSEWEDGAAGGKSQQLTYSWSQVRGPRVALAALSLPTGLHKAVLMLPPYTLSSALEPYVFRVVVVDPTRPWLRGSATVHIAVPSRPLYAVLDGGSRVINGRRAFDLNASNSQDPDSNQSKLVYSWSCTMRAAMIKAYPSSSSSSNESRPCMPRTGRTLNFPGPRSSSWRIAAGVLPVALFTFTVTISVDDEQDSRTSQASVNIKIVNEDAPLVMFEPPSLTSRPQPPKVNPAQRLLISAKGFSVAGRKVVYFWAIRPQGGRGVGVEAAGLGWELHKGLAETDQNSFTWDSVQLDAPDMCQDIQLPECLQTPRRTPDLSNPAVCPTGPSGRHLLLREGALAAGRYVLYFRATSLDTGISATAAMPLVVDSFPRGTLPLVVPRHGIELTTVFGVTISRWKDDDGPLLYEFGFMEDGEFASLSGLYSSRVKYMFLPPGNRKVAVRAYDAWMAAGTSGARVDVALLSTIGHSAVEVQSRVTDLIHKGPSLLWDGNMDESLALAALASASLNEATCNDLSTNDPSACLDADLDVAAAVHNREWAINLAMRSGDHGAAIPSVVKTIRWLTKVGAELSEDAMDSTTAFVVNKVRSALELSNLDGFTFELGADFLHVVSNLLLAGVLGYQNSTLLERDVARTLTALIPDISLAVIKSRAGIAPGVVEENPPGGTRVFLAKWFKNELQELPKEAQNLGEFTLPPSIVAYVNPEDLYDADSVAFTYNSFSPGLNPFQFAASESASSRVVGFQMFSSLTPMGANLATNNTYQPQPPSPSQSHGPTSFRPARLLRLIDNSPIQLRVQRLTNRPSALTPYCLYFQRAADKWTAQGVYTDTSSDAGTAGAVVLCTTTRLADHALFDLPRGPPGPPAPPSRAPPSLEEERRRAAADRRKTRFIIAFSVVGASFLLLLCCTALLYRRRRKSQVLLLSKAKKEQEQLEQRLRDSGPTPEPTAASLPNKAVRTSAMLEAEDNPSALSAPR